MVAKEDIENDSVANGEVCQSAYGLLSCIGSYGSIRTLLSVFGSARQSLEFTRASAGKAKHATDPSGPEATSRSTVDV